LAGGYRPCPAGAHDAWIKDLQHWRTERKIGIGYDGSRYSLPALQWIQSSFIQPQMMVQDRFPYDPVAGKYMVNAISTIWGNAIGD
jgi:iron(II)-dependent oxidoreductase